MLGMNVPTFSEHRFAATGKIKNLAVCPPKSGNVHEPLNPIMPLDLKVLWNHHNMQSVSAPTFTDNLPEATEKMKNLSVCPQQGLADETASRMKFVDLQLIAGTYHTEETLEEDLPTSSENPPR